MGWSLSFWSPLASRDAQSSYTLTLLHKVFRLRSMLKHSEAYCYRRRFNNMRIISGRQVLLFFPIISYNFEPSYKFLYFYKIPIISYKLDIAGIFSTRMHQNEYLFFQKISGGNTPGPPICTGTQLLCQHSMLFCHNSHTVMCPMSECSAVSHVVSREMTVCCKVF